MKPLYSQKWSSSTLDDLKNGLFFGHKSINLSKRKYWHPLMTPYLLGIRNKIAIMNPLITKKCVLRTFFLIALLLQSNGHILIINTNPEYFILNKNLSLLTLEHNSHGFLSRKYQTLATRKISYCCYKWVGGSLTNWKQISKSVLTFAKFSERCEKFLIKNNMDFPRYKKIKTCFKGLIAKQENKTVLAFHEKPDLIFLLNPNENQSIISEANKLHIPIVAFTESNTNIKAITYPIPINGYSLNFIYYCLKKIIKISLN
jgi:small subunit ribosomal protein S2